MKSRKGHILILVENLPVPFDRRVWMEATSLTQAGYKVSVISPCPPEDAQQPNRVIDGIHVYRYPMPKETLNKFSFIREFSYCLWQTARLTRQIWREDRFDVIQSCNPPDTFWLIGRQYKGRGVKYVFDHHDLCPELYESKYHRKDFFWKGLCWMERQQFKTADAVIATNESYRDVALERGRKAPDRVAIVRSGPLLERFSPTPPTPSLKRGRSHLGVYLGVMGVQDGVDYALRAIRHAIDDGLTDTAFTLIGRGDAFDALQRQARDLGLLENELVSFTGRISDDELRQHLSTADFAVAPDPKDPLNDLCTMNKIIEYMAMGLPMVSFDLKETRYSAGEAAVYVRDNDERGMGRAMIELVKDPARRAEMSRIARERFVNGLSWDFSREVLVRFYDELLGHVPATARIQRPVRFEPTPLVVPNATSRSA